MRKLSFIFLPLALCILLCCTIASCDRYDLTGMVGGSSPDADKRFAASRRYNDERGMLSVSVSGDSYTVYAASDAHIAGKSDNFRSFVERYLSDSQAAPFALFLGDASGSREDGFNTFNQITAPIEAAGHKLFCTPGNHDLFWGLWDRYVEKFKTSSYCFEVITPTQGKDLFICLDSASGTLGADQRVSLGRTLTSAKGRYRRIIVFTHTHFIKTAHPVNLTGDINFSSQFNLEEAYDLEKLFSDYGVSLVLSGHDHSFAQAEFKNVRYITLASICDEASPAYFYTLNISSSDIGLTSVELR